MPTHAERRVVPYTPEQMYALVADIERYPAFLPWCLDVKTRHRDGHILTADMMIGFKALRERFSTRVTLLPPVLPSAPLPGRIQVEYLNGPFHHLNNHWVFHPHAKGCEVEFYIDFAFRSTILRVLIGALFNEAVRIMVRAFETRARKLYGRAGSGATTSSPPAGTAAPRP